ncbi:MAG: PQQ-binding-like beta-propeller repeat protein [Chitinophagaceae bacterium]
MKLLLFFSLIITLLSACRNPPGKTASFRQDGSDHGYYSGKDISDLKPLWTYETGAAVRSTPLLDDNRLYVGSCDSNFYAIYSKNGKKIWTFKARAAVSSSPSLSNGILYFQDRSNTLYALNEMNGREKWQLKLGNSVRYDWGFDYYQSSPLIAVNTLFIGSGDGNLYALDPDNGNIKWKFNCTSMVRSSPAYSKGMIVVGDCKGRLYGIDAAKGIKSWQFNTTGDTLDNEKEGFDRQAIIASPVIKDDIVITGGRDGYLYANDLKTGVLKWKYDYEVSWVISSVAIKDSLVISGTSDGQFINALNLFTGKQIWRASTAVVWASPLIVGNTVLSAQVNGFIYLHDLASGKEKNRIRIGDRFHSSPIYNDGQVFVGNDDGNLYAFTVSDENNKPGKSKRAVFWTKDFSVRRYGLDAYLKDYFVSEGYELLDEDTFAEFMEARVRDRIPSMVVLATNYFPEKTVAGTAGNSPLYQYLHAGGKIVTTGLNPAAFFIDYKTRKFEGLDYGLSKNILGFEYPYKDLRSHKGFFSSTPTKEGLKWGLTGKAIGHSGVDTSRATALSMDENGDAAYWVKNYGFKEGTGLVQFWITPDRLDLVDDLKRVAEFGLR